MVYFPLPKETPNKPKKGEVTFKTTAPTKDPKGELGINVTSKTKAKLTKIAGKGEILDLTKKKKVVATFTFKGELMLAE